MQHDIIELDEVDSTNTWLAAHAAALPHGTAVTARRQNAGRGQRGNTWESEPGMNLTLSLLLRPYRLPAVRSFSLSEAVAVGVAEAVEDMVPEVRVSIKWPNDIYVGDRKLGGILIENSLRGAEIDRTVVGLGLNVNQRRFLSDAPNPVSLAQLTDREFPVEDLARRIITAMLEAADHDNHEGLHGRYMTRLWRGTGIHPFVESATRRRFDASVQGVESTGHIILAASDGRRLRYAFKEISWPL